MKAITTIFCCIGFMAFGAFLAIKDSTPIFPGNQVAVASVPNVLGKMPFDFQSNLNESTITKSETKPDTVRVKDTVTVVRQKYVYVPKRKRTAVDTLYVPMPIPGKVECVAVKNKISGVREEQTLDSSHGSKPSDITLTVDGHVVYETKNDNHSTK